MSKTAIKPTREENFAEWYQQVIQAADLAENSPVRGCMVLKPYGYAVWENIQKTFDARLKAIGVQNAYFPLLIPIDFLSKEAEHIEGFAKECAVVTHHKLKKNSQGKLVPDGELSAPYIIRPTSEAIIGSIVAKWIQTYRDLPLKLNQWCNVMRWEMRPRTFLRNSEFLWQEGHTIFETEQEAQQDALKMLELYYDLIANDLAMPAIKGKKTEDEKFPGAKDTYTIEVMMQDGKALQAATSHYLGQTFSAAFNIKYLGRDNKEHLTYTSSWGISTRLIGGIIMSHADDNGLILPPQIAPYQVVIIPIFEQAEIKAYALKVQEKLTELNIRAHIDFTEYSNSNKSWKWIKKGVPIRIEIGLNELADNSVTFIRRDLEKGAKKILPIEEMGKICDILKDITHTLRMRADLYSKEKIKKVDSLYELEHLFLNDFKGLVLIKTAETNKSEFALLSKKYSLTKRCVPTELPTFIDEIENVLVGKSY
jgi:prolyl-tRNA synthetase